MQTRLDRFAKIRRWLDSPMEQSPNPDKILSQMFTEEQAFLNRLTNTGQPWSLTSVTLRARSGKSEYTLEGVDENLGKVYFVVRETGNAEQPFLPIPHDDVNAQDYGRMMQGANNSLLVPEKISFYREYSANQELKAIIQPAPAENLTYKITFFSGEIDRFTARLTDSAFATELIDYVDLKTALALVPYSFWRIESGEKEVQHITYNQMRRREIEKGLLMQLGNEQMPGTLAAIVHTYIKQINSPVSFEMDYWNG